MLNVSLTSAGRSSMRGRVELKKCVLADLHVDEPRLPLLVIDPERFAVPHFLRVVGNRLRDIWHTDSNVVHHYDTTVGVLRHPFLNANPAMSPATNNIAPRIQPPEMEFINGRAYSATSREPTQARVWSHTG